MQFCNNKQRWNEDKWRCECKELIDNEICDKKFIWNSSNCECACDTSCDVGEYLDYKNFKCRNKLVNKLVEKCSENIDGNKMLYNENLDVIPLNYYNKVCNSCTIYIVLFAVFFITSICIAVFLFIFIDIFKKIMFVLSFILVLKQQFNECNSTECNSIEHLNGKYKRN